MIENVILVDSQDHVLGEMEKMEAHEKGVLHRAFSILIFNSQGDWLIHKRANSKYHSAGLWTNTCCSHPRPGERIEDALKRRLMEEVGLTADLHFDHSFIYKTALENGLLEHEFDHVYVGKTDLVPILNEQEVSEFRYIQTDVLKAEIETSPEKFTVWFKMIFNQYLQNRSDHD